MLQYAPVYCGRQAHTKLPLARSVQVPLFWHGNMEQEPMAACNMMLKGN